MRLYPWFFLPAGIVAQEDDVPAISYTTSEQDTGLTWIDGKAIFQKTIVFGALPNNTNKDVDHDITTIEECIFIEGYAQNAEAATPELQWIPVIHRSSSTNGIGVSCGTTQVRIQAAGNFSVYEECHITLYYTKV